MAMAITASVGSLPLIRGSLEEQASDPKRFFKVTLRLRGKEEERVVVNVAEDEFIAEAAERRAGLLLPQSCRSGACSACAALLLSGRVEHSIAQTFLSDRHISRGFVLTCVAYPLSDLVLDTHQESLLYLDEDPPFPVPPSSSSSSSISSE